MLCAKYTKKVILLWQMYVEKVAKNMVINVVVFTYNLVTQANVLAYEEKDIQNSCCI